MGTFDRNIKTAQALAKQGKLPDALVAIDAALKDARDAMLFRARLLQALGRPAEALAEIEYLDGTNVSAAFLDMRAKLEEKLDRFDAATLTLTRMLPLVPAPAAVLARRAMLHQTTGRLDAAIEDLDAAISKNPNDTELYRLRGGLVPMTKRDPTLAKMERAEKSVKPGSPAAVTLDFAMSKALEDIGNPDAAFKRLLRANAGMRALKPYDISERLRDVKAHRDAFGTTKPEQSVSTSTFAPIFVTGMPRSGTTLVEHILSSHPDVAAGGEARAFLPHLTQHVGTPSAPPPSGLDLSDAALQAVADGYAETMRAQLGDAPRYTDKTMQTLLFAGPLLAAMPKAHIVLVRRNPNAIALSLFKQVFLPGKQLFSYSLDDIRAYQRSFDEMVSFWSDRLPARFHVVDYEDIVTDPEPQIRALLDQVELDFDAACLRPEDNGRAVKTLSAVAVRQPINMGALDGWQLYARQLGATVPSE